MNNKHYSLITITANHMNRKGHARVRLRIACVACARACVIGGDEGAAAIHNGASVSLALALLCPPSSSSP